jgi:basic membrane protein A
LEEKPPPTVMLLSEMGFEYENTYINSLFRGVLRFYGESMENQKRRGVLYDVYESGQGTDAMKNALIKISEEGAWDLIIAGAGFFEAVKYAAPKFPRQKYALADEGDIRLENVRQYLSAEQEGSYMVGAAAALKSIEDGVKNPEFGFIGGINSAVIARFENGFVKGVHSILPASNVRVFYANSWISPDAAYAEARKWYSSGVFAVYTAAGGTGIGAIKSAKEERLAGKNVWVIGVDTDQYDEGLYMPNASAVYTSMIKRVDEAAYDAINSVYSGSFHSSDKILQNLANKGVGYTLTNPELSENVREQLEKIEKEIGLVQ